jgi:hypothetical protein
MLTSNGLVKCRILKLWIGPRGHLAKLEGRRELVIGGYASLDKSLNEDT